MFENIRKVLDEYEDAWTKINTRLFEVSKEDEDNIIYFDMHLAKALMKDAPAGDEAVAKIILATKGLSNEIKVKVE